MSENKKPLAGTIGWFDLTVDNADKVRDFYQGVVGWNHESVSMGDYNDYSMIPAGSKDPVAGVCHKRGGNADLPSQWLMYIIVEDVDSSVDTCREMGGEVITGPKSMGSARYAVIKDPAGAVCALYQP
jgi:predicted enzyme related to lactoylglutathione lyase